MSLIEFLRARFGEVAEWTRFLRTLAAILPEGQALLDLADYIERDIEAKRQIVNHAEHWQKTLHHIPEGWTDAGATAYRMAMDWTLHLLALPYSEHRDYREEWKVSCCEYREES